MRFCVVTKDILPGEDEAECLAYAIDDHADAFKGSTWEIISEDEPDDFDPMAEVARLRAQVEHEQLTAGAAHAEIKRLRFQLAQANNLIDAMCYADAQPEEAQP
jgi:hypothetical protein